MAYRNSRTFYNDSPVRKYFADILGRLTRGEQPPLLTETSAWAVSFHNPQEFRDFDFLLEDSFLYAMGKDVLDPSPRNQSFFRRSVLDLEKHHRRLGLAQDRINASSSLSPTHPLLHYETVLRRSNDPTSPEQRAGEITLLNEYANQRFQLQLRNRTIVKQLMEGVTISVVADTVDLSVSRISSILNKQIRVWNHPSRSLSRYAIAISNLRGKRRFDVALMNERGGVQEKITGLTLGEVVDVVHRHSGITLVPCL